MDTSVSRMGQKTYHFAMEVHKNYQKLPEPENSGNRKFRTCTRMGRGGQRFFQTVNWGEGEGKNSMDHLYGGDFYRSLTFMNLKIEGGGQGLFFNCQWGISGKLFYFKKWGWGEYMPRWRKTKGKRYFML